MPRSSSSSPLPSPPPAPSSPKLTPTLRPPSTSDPPGLIPVSPAFLPSPDSPQRFPHPVSPFVSTLPPLLPTCSSRPRLLLGSGLASLLRPTKTTPRQRTCRGRTNETSPSASPERRNKTERKGDRDEGRGRGKDGRAWGQFSVRKGMWCIQLSSAVVSCGREKGRDGVGGEGESASWSASLPSLPPQPPTDSALNARFGCSKRWSDCCRSK